jgi:preprotein translocase subunit SecA
VEYKLEGYNLFVEMMAQIRRNVIFNVSRIEGRERGRRREMGEEGRQGGRGSEAGTWGPTVLHT